MSKLDPCSFVKVMLLTVQSYPYLNSPQPSVTVVFSDLLFTINVIFFQFDAMRRLKNGEGGLMCGNFRPPQKLNGRVVSEFDG